MDSTTVLIERKLLQHEGKVRLRLEGMSARKGFLYQALEDYLQLPELAEKRVTVFPTGDGGEYIVNYSRTKQTLGESHFTEAIEIRGSSWRMPDRKREVPETERVFIALRVYGMRKGERQCIMLSLFDRTPSVIEYFTWLVGYMCERFPDAKLIDYIEDADLRRTAKLRLWRPLPDYDKMTFASDLRAKPPAPTLPPAPVVTKGIGKGKGLSVELNEIANMPGTTIKKKLKKVLEMLKAEGVKMDDWQLAELLGSTPKTIQRYRSDFNVDSGNEY